MFASPMAGGAVLELPALRRLVPGEPLVTLSSLIGFYGACPATPSGSLMTRRWRGMDSNFRFREQCKSGLKR
jgi:hypothetical protein